MGESLYRLDITTINKGKEFRMRNATYKQILDKFRNRTEQYLIETKMTVVVTLNNSVHTTLHFATVTVEKLQNNLQQYA